MPSLSALAALATTFATVSGTGVLLPLYVYPSAAYNDGAANWQPVISAISAHSSVPWQIVINPASGPGSGGPGNGDINYESGVTQLNALPNAQTLGYVHTSYGNRAAADVEADMTTWKTWGSPYAVDGIFLDETTTATNAANATYLSAVVAFAKSTFGNAAPVVCNFGTAAPAAYYSVCDELVVFEGSLADYDGTATLAASVPKGSEAGQAVVLVHDFSGAGATLAALEGYVHDLKAAGVGWGYFTSGGYDSVTAGVATVGNVGGAFYSA